MAADALAPCITSTSGPTVHVLTMKDKKLLQWGRISMTCAISVLENDKKCKQYFLFSERNSKWKRLTLIWILDLNNLLYRDPGVHLNIKMPSYQYSDSHYTDKTVSWPSYLYYENPIPGKMVFILKWDPGIDNLLLMGTEKLQNK